MLTKAEVGEYEASANLHDLSKRALVGPSLDENGVRDDARDGSIASVSAEDDDGSDVAIELVRDHGGCASREDFERLVRAEDVVAHRNFTIGRFREPLRAARSFARDADES